MMTVLKIFGPQIKNLVFGVEFDVDMHYLASNCANLETIDFLDSKILDSEAASRWTPETFLPKLKKVYRTSWSWKDGCLGVWGLLIEKKSTLAHLSLRCCHFGTNVALFKYLFRYLIIVFLLYKNRHTILAWNGANYPNVGLNWNRWRSVNALGSRWLLCWKSFRNVRNSPTFICPLIRYL